MNIFELLGYTYLTDRELMQQALEALDWAADCIEPRKPHNCDCPVCVASDALRERLAQPEQEPVVWMYQDKSTHEVRFQKHMRGFVDHGATYETPLYTTPPRREWVGLTEGERVAIAEACGAMDAGWLVFVEAVERALKEKNNG